MTRQEARDSRTKAIDGLRESLRTMGAGGLTGSAAIEAFAKAHQCVGRLQGIDELELYSEACERGQRARFPLPWHGLEIDPELSIEQVEAACRMAVRTLAEDDEDDRLDVLAQADGIASTH